MAFQGHFRAQSWPIWQRGLPVWLDRAVRVGAPATQA